MILSETLQLHAGPEVVDQRPKSHAVPICKQHPLFLMTHRRFADLFALEKTRGIYTRITNLTAAFEERIALLLKVVLGTPATARNGCCLPLFLARSRR